MFRLTPLAWSTAFARLHRFRRAEWLELHRAVLLERERLLPRSLVRGHAPYRLGARERVVGRRRRPPAEPSAAR